MQVSDTLNAYLSVIDERDAKLEERKESFWRGGALGGAGVVGGAAGIGGLCIVSGSFTFGWGCAAVLLALGGDLLLTGLAIDDGIQAGNSITNPQGLDASAEDLFGQLRPNQGS